MLVWWNANKIRVNYIRVKGVLFTVLITFVFLAAFVTASPMASLEVTIIPPITGNVVELNEEFELGSSQNKAVLTGHEVNIELLNLDEINGEARAYLKISSSNYVLRFYLKDSERVRNDDTLGLKIKALNFIKQGSDYTATRLVFEKKEAKWSDSFIEFIRRLLFG